MSLAGTCCCLLETRKAKDEIKARRKEGNGGTSIRVLI